MEILNSDRNPYKRCKNEDGLLSENIPVIVDNIYLSSFCKRYKGKELIRTKKIKVYDCIISPVPNSSQDFIVEGEARKAQYTITFKGIITLKTGGVCINFNSEFSSYLKKKKFSIVGYDLSVIKQNNVE